VGFAALQEADLRGDLGAIMLLEILVGSKAVIIREQQDPLLKVVVDVLLVELVNGLLLRGLLVVVVHVHPPCTGGTMPWHVVSACPRPSYGLPRKSGQLVRDPSCGQ
jgi:hypothetical protein